MTEARLLTVEAMRTVDAAAIAGGTPGARLMERAGAAVAERARALAPADGRVLVLCGPGNNGGDGFVAARLLAEAGYAVEVVLLGDRAALKGDAAGAAAAWTGAVTEGVPDTLGPCDLVIDALFGAGLARDLDGAARTLAERVNEAGLPVLAVDVPSGLDGDTGAVRGVAIRARATVTFVALKPGHLLQPGRALCGELHLADIGAGEAALQAGWAACAPPLYRNGPALWGAAFPHLTGESHKYTRGHAVVLSGPAHRTGAARMAARGALRVGAGLVTVASPRDALAENAAHLTAIMLHPCDSADDLDDLLTDERLNAVLLGPGLGTGEPTRERVMVAASAGRALVLDADALTSFKGQPQVLAGHIRDGEARAVLTPHAGEFARLFGGTAAAEEGLSKVEQARRAAAQMGAVVVLKGADTVIADADGRAAINDHATPYLGTAGAGDVLAGLTAGLLAQGMAPFEAAAAAVWLHGDAGLRHGPGLIAEDIPELMPQVLSGLLSRLR
ncbi:NAD(P)H-hydrate dehydratase [Methylobacterium radiodurans]|uniref:Bifunctional NAD(P)H-hydrate repair enzyme n=1 Tax=Methylobacterium radiodurans TaxID=2202828 RepID=A0A2U8VNH1_9HYPH|nr:NAD(P)H-hydrate dehydratase [Methylobacterium radiodurans]AWN35239.1 bifunctional ADP-dependent NAD(P)H-hydrate dehydratase/NAD(P)H-hydrate epimerase [Methylobacterium radiodurans]